MNEIMVSISCITYNHVNYIEDAINGFLMQQTNFKYEVLIHDDASTDGTADIIRRYAEKYPDIIKPIIQEENQYSQGVKRIGRINSNRAKGKYIAVCEGDDFWTSPNKLQKQVNYMEDNPECTLCSHTVKIQDELGRIIGTQRPVEGNKKIGVKDVILGGGGFFGTASLLYRAADMEKPPCFYNESPVGDYPLQIYLTARGYAYFIDDPMAVYRTMVPGSWSERHSLSKENRIQFNYEYVRMLQSFDNFFDNQYNDIVNYKISETNFSRLLEEKNIKEAKIEIYYRNLSFFNKVKIRVDYYTPNLYHFLVRCRNRIWSIIHGNKY